MAPSMLLTEAELNEVRAAAQGPHDGIRRRVLAGAERILDEPIAEPDMDRPWGPYLSAASAGFGHVKRCAFTWLLTGREEFHARAKASIDAMLGWDRWIDPYHERLRRRYGLMTGLVASTLAAYLDFCGPLVEEDEHRDIADTFRRMAIEPFLHDTDLPASMFVGKLNNWVPVMVGGAGLMSLLLMDDEPIYAHILERCAFHLRRYLDWVNDDGSTDEGGAYWAFGMEHALPLADALQRNAHRLPAALRWRRADRFSRHPKLRHTGYFPLHCMQGAEFVVNFGDCDVTRADRFQPLFYRLARTWDDPRLQWAGDRLTGDDPMALIWRDPDIEPQPPEGLLPSRAFHGAGWGIVREDLTSDDGVLLAVRAGNNAKTHCHRDLGTFILRSGGCGLIVDPGKPEYCEDYWIHGAFTYGRETIGHNCVLIDGEGQQGGEAERAEITRLEDRKDAKHLTVEVRAEGIGLLLHRREFDLTLGDPTRLDLRDEVRLDRGAPITWRFHVPADAGVSVEDARVTVNADGARLTMLAAAPVDLRMTIDRDGDLPAVVISPQEVGESYALELACELCDA